MLKSVIVLATVVFQVSDLTAKGYMAGMCKKRLRDL